SIVSFLHLIAVQPLYLEPCTLTLLSAELPFVFRCLPSQYAQTIFRSPSTLSFYKSSKVTSVLKCSRHRVLQRRLWSHIKNPLKMKMESPFMLKRHEGKSQYIDIAVNLTDLMFQGIYHSRKKHECDIERVLCRAASAGVTKIIVIGGNLIESREAISLCRTYCDYIITHLWWAEMADTVSSCQSLTNVYGPSLFATVGVHPTRCGEFEGNENQGAPDYLQSLRELIANNRDVVAAIGEIGLDFDRTKFCSEEMQLKYFEFQLQLVAEFKLPMLLHMRAAAMPFCDILRRNLMTWKSVGGVVHSFTGSYLDSQQLLQLDLSIGINGCSVKTSESLQVVRSIPLDRLLLETGQMSCECNVYIGEFCNEMIETSFDSPWCEIRASHAGNSLVKTRTLDATKAEKWDGKQVKGRNEPANIVQVAEIVSELKDYSNYFEEFCLR
ncbi:hydrolase, TatD family protein, partial [Cardiosporidium cionae]